MIVAVMPSAMLRNLTGTAIAAVLAAASPAAGEEVRGPAAVIDGDTLEVAGQRFDLAGIDAPEPAQTCAWPNKPIACGEIATGALKDLTTAAVVVCDALAPREEGGATQAHCRAGGYDLGWNMIHTGWAVAAPGAPPVYRETEAKARAANRGLWKGSFEMPWLWRESSGRTD
ncbi:MAG: thermonuclease family protein [Rhodovibrionaceae bacterium]|nr:thermonuclease family protein [Rhodovibrionaceae bacterium]